LLVVLSVPVFAWGFWSGWAAALGPAENLEPYRRARLQIFLDAGAEPLDQRAQVLQQQQEELDGRVPRIRALEGLKAFGLLCGGAVLLNWGLDLRKGRPAR
jgi:hypothetical protein